MRQGRGGLLVGAGRLGRGGGLAIVAGDDAPAPSPFDPLAYPGLTLDMDPATITPDDLDGSSLLVWTAATSELDPPPEYSPSALVHAPTFRGAGLTLPAHPCVAFARSNLSGLVGPNLGDLVDPGDLVGPDGSEIYAVISAAAISPQGGTLEAADAIFGDVSGYLTFGVVDAAGALCVVENEWNGGDHSVLAPGLVLNTATVVSSSRGGSVQNARINAGAPVTAACTPLGGGTQSYVGLGYGQVNPLQGELYRLLVYQGHHTDVQHAAIVAALQGIYL